MGVTNREIINKVKGFLLRNRGYIKKSPNYIANRLDVNLELARIGLYEAKRAIKNPLTTATVERAEAEKKVINVITKSSREDILVVGDLHAPFILAQYLEWCYELAKEYKTNKTIFIGDIVDGHSWSYHETDVDGFSVGHELEAAKRQLALAYKLFPNVDVTLGNHDLLIARKARTAGLSRHFIRDLGEVLNAPKTWNFQHEFKYNNVNYIHGSIGNAFTRAKDSRTSTVQGHLHSQAFVQYSVSEKDSIFGLQIGCGLDHSKYAFEYAKPMTKKPIISAGLVLDNGTLPILRLMKL